MLPAPAPESCRLPAPSRQIFRQSGQIFGKKGQKLDFLWCGFVFSRDFRRPKGAKTKICFTSGAFVVLLSSSLWGGGRVHWVQVGRTFRGSGPAGVPAVVLWRCVPCLLSALSLCACRVACKYASIWRFKGVFSVVWGVRVGLYCLRALRGLCDFVRVNS